MSKSMPEKREHIRPEMIVLDVVSKYRQTEAVLRQYDQQAGECICCQALFKSLKDVAEKYDLDLNRLLADLEAAINIH